jgi:hypothetical protein
MQVDIGFGDVVFPRVAAVSLPPALDFSPTRFPAYSRESVIAEFTDRAEKQAQWTSFRRKSRLDAAPESFGEVMRQTVGFLAPVIHGLADDRSFHLSWRPPGPWT